MSASISLESRAEVTRLIAAEDTGAAVADYLDDPERTKDYRSVDATRLKVATFALLVHPLTKGLEDYLEKGEEMVQNFGKDSLRFCERMGEEMSSFIYEAIDEDPNSEYLYDIQAARALIAPDGPGRNTLYAGILPAATHSVRALYDAAGANRAVILDAKDPNLTDPDDIVSAVARSTSLPLAETRSHFEWLSSIEYYTHVTAYNITKSRQQPLLRYDPVRRLAKIISSPAELPIYYGGTDKIKDEYIGDDRIGCPASFKPKLVVGLYDKVVKEKASHDMWVPINDPRIATGGVC